MQNKNVIPVPEVLLSWRLGDDTGTSSLLIWHTLTGIKDPSRYTSEDTPCDVSDFGRCYRLLQLMPEWEDKLELVAEKYPNWRKLVTHWKDVKNAYERYLSSNDSAEVNGMIKELRELGRSGH